MSQAHDLKFGAFMGPYHPTNLNPVTAFERDLEIIEALDRYDLDEAWFGEHHSGGWETIGAPDIMVMAAAQRTKKIRLGMGVVAIPFHHPFNVAARVAFLDNLTRGRIQLATGPGLLMPDHLTYGLDPVRGREHWAAGLEAVHRLLTETEPLTIENEFFTIRDGLLQVRPYQDPFPLVVAGGNSPAGATLAGRHCEGLLTFGAKLVNPDLVAAGAAQTRSLRDLWDIAEESAAAAGRTISRSGWRFAAPIHLAETREQAFADVREGAAAWVVDYLGGVLGQPAPEGPREEVIDAMVERGHWIVGTPDDAVEAIENLWEQSGGFGGLLAINLDWTSKRKVIESYEMLADYVVPRFRGRLVGTQRAAQHHADNKEELLQLFMGGIQRAEEQRAAQQAAKA